MAIRGPRRERDGSIVYNSHVPLKQPVAQAKRKHRFRFILTEIDKPFFILVMVLLVFGLLMMLLFGEPAQVCRTWSSSDVCHELS